HPLRKALLQDAQQFYERFLNEHGDDPALRAEVAAASHRIARITGETGSPAEAVPQFHQTVALWESLIAARPDDPAYREGLARTLNDLGEVLVRLEDRRDEAFRAFRRAQDLLEPLIAEEPRSVPRRRELSLVLQNIAPLQYADAEPEEVIKGLERSLAIESQL